MRDADIIALFKEQIAEGLAGDDPEAPVTGLLTGSRGGGTPCLTTIALSLSTWARISSVGFPARPAKTRRWTQSSNLLSNVA